MTNESRAILTAQLKRDEGIRLAAYQDSEGFWTIGCGRLIDAKRKGGISFEEVEFLLQNDIRSVVDDVLIALPWVERLDEVRQRVIYNMAFNLGTAGLLKFTKTLKHIREGRWREAAVEMLMSTWASQVGNRALRLAEAMETGVEK